MSAVAAEPKRKLTAEDYLALDRAAERRSELFNGAMFVMLGGSEWHSLITANVSGELRNRVRRGGCRVYSNDFRVHVPSLDSFVFPDVIVVCGETRLREDGHGDTLLNPTLVVEVLSPSTQNWDRGGKFFHYQQIESLREYVLVSQDVPRVDTFTRQDVHRWLLTTTQGAQNVAALASLNVELPLSEIYEGVKFPPAASLPPAPTA